MGSLERNYLSCIKTEIYSSCLYVDQILSVICWINVWQRFRQRLKCNSFPFQKFSCTLILTKTLMSFMHLIRIRALCSVNASIWQLFSAFSLILSGKCISFYWVMRWHLTISITAFQYQVTFAFPWFLLSSCWLQYENTGKNGRWFCFWQFVKVNWNVVRLRRQKSYFFSANHVSISSRPVTFYLKCCKWILIFV